MNTFETILTRRSIRQFDPTRPITDEQIHKMLEAAMHAPSAQNSRPWEFVVVTDPEGIRKVGEFEGGQKSYETAQAVIIVLGVKEKECPGNLINDCSAAAQNIVLEAWEMGIGSCWCGIYPVESRTNGAVEFLGLPEGVVPFCAIPLGYPAENPAAKGFYNESLVHYNKW